jgi:hypothetical protein
VFWMLLDTSNWANIHTGLGIIKTNTRGAAC